MRIERLDLLRYGKFADRTLVFPAQPCDFHVVVGPNEAGKSTVRQAIIDLLYGIPRNTPLGFVHDMSELRLGARLHDGDRTLDMLRTKGNRHTLRDAGGTPLPDDTLAPFVGAGSREFFTRMFGLDHPALVEGGQSILSASDDVGQILFQSAAGVATLGRVRAELEQEAEQLWTRRRAESRLYYQAADRLAQADAALLAGTTHARAWGEAMAALDRARAALADERARHATVSRRRDLLERVRRVAPILRALDDVQERLDALGASRVLPAEAGAILAQASGDLAAEQVRIDELAVRGRARPGRARRGGGRSGPARACRSDRRTRRAAPAVSRPPGRAGASRGRARRADPVGPGAVRTPWLARARPCADRRPAAGARAASPRRAAAAYAARPAAGRAGGRASGAAAARRARAVGGALRGLA